MTQAEAVIDLIKAKSDKSFDVALEQLEGALSAKIKDITALLVDVLGQSDCQYRLPDEDIEERTYEKLFKEFPIQGIILTIF